jgi:hypothetical protein
LVASARLWRRRGRREVRRMGQVFIGLDWAEDHHDVFIEDDTGRRLGGGRLPEGVEGVARFHEWAGAHVDDPADVMIATETDLGLFIGPWWRPVTRSWR